MSVQVFDKAHGDKEPFMKDEIVKLIGKVFKSKQNAVKTLENLVRFQLKDCGKFHLWKLKIETNKDAKELLLEQKYVQRKDLIVFFHPTEYFPVPKAATLIKNNPIIWEVNITSPNIILIFSVTSDQ